MKDNFKIARIVITGFMAGICFALTFFSIKIPLPVGTSLIHFGNIFMIISSILFGPYIGGLSGGIGMALFDLFSGTFVLYAPGTFIVKFFAGYTCGKLCRDSVYTKNKKIVIFSSIFGILVNVIGSPINTILVKVLFNNFQLYPIIISSIGDLGLSVFNGIIAVLIAIPSSFYISIHIKDYKKFIN